MPTIHPTACVDAGAEIGDGCRIGPYCVIGPDVRLGSGCTLHSHVVVDGATRIGSGSEIFSFACLGKRTQDLKYKGGHTAVSIGSNCIIREYVTIHQATSEGDCTTVGDDCVLLAYCHVAHDCVLGDGIIMSNGVNLGGHVSVDDRAVIGGLCGVHQFVRIGSMAMVSATAKVVQDVPPFGLVDGSPAHLVTINKIGMQRNGKDAATIRCVNQAYRTLFRSNLKLENAMRHIRDELEPRPELDELLAFLASSDRGVVRPRMKKRP